MTDLNEQKFHAFIGKMLGDLGGAFSVPTVRIGLRLGLFDALHQGGPATAEELAKRAGGLAPRYVREWLLAQSSSGFSSARPGGVSVTMMRRRSSGSRFLRMKPSFSS